MSCLVGRPWVSGFHFPTSDPGMPLKLEHTASQRALAFSASVVLRVYIWKSPASAHRKESLWGHGSHMNWLSRKSQVSPWTEKERRGVATLGCWCPRSFMLPYSPWIYGFLIWCNSCLLSELLQAGISICPLETVSGRSPPALLACLSPALGTMDTRTNRGCPWTQGI